MLCILIIYTSVCYLCPATSMSIPMVGARIWSLLLTAVPPAPTIELAHSRRSVHICRMIQCVLSFWVSQPEAPYVRVQHMAAATGQYQAVLGQYCLKHGSVLPIQLLLTHPKSVSQSICFLWNIWVSDSSVYDSLHNTSKSVPMQAGDIQDGECRWVIRLLSVFWTWLWRRHSGPPWRFGPAGAHTGPCHPCSPTCPLQSPWWLWFPL